MGMFGAGGGGNFDPGNWVDMKVYHEVMHNDSGGSFHNDHKNKKDDKNQDEKNKKFSLGFKIINIVAWVGFFLSVIIKVLIDRNYKYPQKTPIEIEIAFTIIPIAWLFLSYIGGLIILHFIIKDKERLIEENKDEESEE